ncbi:2OG-Fe(II) oxygenase family protein [Brevundimonas sp.]|uniref:2OG-Fe(II) oxygenase n=1 Tax=Brevundimonas sp. TaxID=1871086 RepID=UPI0025E5FC5E|nr:2OG-Fe(II) oxygenase family protein [Brevundimonas sp.]
MSLAVNPELDLGAFAERLATTGRAHIPEILTQAAAERLRTALERETPWSRSINIGGRGADVPVDTFERFPPDQQHGLYQQVWMEAERAFQYLFDRFRITETRAAGGPVPSALMEADDFLNGPFLDFARRLTGRDEASFVDCQATRYVQGHFLTRHDDAREDHGRLYAYVLGLSREWRTDWGGLLQFLGPDGHVEEAFAPAFNSLNVFKVPADHAVSIVAPFAGAPRLSITGWIRSRR